MLARLSPAWLWLLVLVQVAIPASYYLVRDDRDDERFAWRMFSAIRMSHCEVRASERVHDGALRPVDVPRSLHASWIRSLERGRARVIEQFLSLRCRDRTVASSLLERSCKSAAGQRLPPLAYSFDCASRELEATR